MKYPRTYHLPWSQGITNDDKVLVSLDSFINKEIVITEKLDGGNACITRDNVYARTHSQRAKHNSFDWLKSQHAKIRNLIPEEFSIFGENMYAVHSIKYTKLKSYFYIFAIFDKRKKHWLSCLDVQHCAELFSFPYVPILWEGIVSSEQELKILIKALLRKGSQAGGDYIEGLVIRRKCEFTQNEFTKNVSKWVRKDHIQTDNNWQRNQMKNEVL